MKHVLMLVMASRIIIDGARRLYRQRVSTTIFFAILLDNAYFSTVGGSYRYDKNSTRLYVLLL